MVKPERAAAIRPARIEPGSWLGLKPVADEATGPGSTSEEKPRRAIRQATTPTPILRDMASTRLPRVPSQSGRTKPANPAPTVAPSVLSA